MIWHRVYFKGIKNGNFSVDDAPGRTLCVFITAGPGTKLCAWGRRIVEDMCVLQVGQSLIERDLLLLNISYICI